MAWVIDIDASTFNVISDFVATFISAALIAALGFAYSYLVWQAIKKGSGVVLEQLLGPPDSFYDALNNARQGGACVLVFSVAWILAVASFSHPFADFYLKFVSVEVSQRTALLLGTDTAPTPSYALLGDITTTAGMILPPVKRLLARADFIANGLSRFSLLITGLTASESSESFTFNGFRTWVFKSDLFLIRSFPDSLDIECNPFNPLDEKYGVNGTFELFYRSDGELWMHNATASSFVPDCDYEQEIPNSLSDNENTGWSVVDWIKIFPPKDESLDPDIPSFFGWKLDGTFSKLLVNELSTSETALPVDREDWTLGRKMRDKLSIYIGGPQGLEVQFAYSVIGWPIQAWSQDSLEVATYVISSWSFNCPVFEGNKLSVVNYSQSKHSHESPSGCVINMQVFCTLFHEDDVAGEKNPIQVCMINDVLSSITLKGVEVDQTMLAVYAGTALRNQAYAIDSQNDIQVNAIPSAYVITRRMVDGTIPVQELRPSVSYEYFILMLLPLVLAIPLLLFAVGKPTPPVPKTVWDAVVFGNRETIDSTLTAETSDSYYPPLPEGYRFGIVKKEEHDHLGLGTSFVPKSGRLTLRQMTNPMPHDSTIPSSGAAVAQQPIVQTTIQYPSASPQPPPTMLVTPRYHTPNNAVSSPRPSEPEIHCQPSYGMIRQAAPNAHTVYGEPTTREQRIIKIVGDSKHITTTRLDEQGRRVQHTTIQQLTPAEMHRYFQHET